MTNKKKYYAVRKGNKVGIFENWSDCQQSINGFSNAEYKSFGNIEDAEAYIKNEDIGEKHRQAAIDLDAAIAYVDGSYSDAIKRYSFGCIIITPDGDVIKKAGYGDDPNALTIRNIAGELQGTMYAIKFAAEAGYKNLIIRHDYEGISKWYEGAWKAKDSIVKKYIDFISKYRDQIKVKFEKVQAHTGDKYNEEVDSLAKDALKNGEKVKKDEYGLIAKGIKSEDLKAIIDIMIDDVKGLVVNSTRQAYAEMYVLTSPDKEKIVIKYYPENHQKIHVQGKPQKLFSLFSTYVTELVDVDQIPVILNEYHKVEIHKDSIEEQFKVYFPKACGNLPDKIERVLHQAIYNLNLDGDMFDPTYLAFPSYRALEGFLKFILDKYKIDCDNCFNMFKRSGSGAYRLEAKYEVNIGSGKKIAYFNKCYNYYNNNRHTLFHWDDPAAPIDTTHLIGNVEQAKKHIKDTVELIEEFFHIT